MRIVIHQPRMSYFSGGAERMAMLLASHWSKNGTQTTLIVARAMNQGFRNFLRDFHGNHYDYPILRSDRGLLGRIRKTCPTLPLYSRVLSPQYYWDIESISFNLFSRWLYRSLEYDLLSVHYYMDLLGLPLKRPILFHFHGSHEFPWATALLRKAQKHLACSAYIRDRVRTFHRIDPEVVYNPVDCNLFQPARPEKSRLYDVLFAGRLYPNKGIDTVLTLAQKMGQTRFAVVGSGPLERKLQEAQRHLRNLDYLGPKRYEEMPSVYQAAKVLICPSYSDPFPLVNLEAMASGIPVVASRIGGIPEAVDDQVGRLVTPQDVSGFETSILELLKSEGLREELGTKGRQRCLDRFEVGKVASHVMDVYSDFLGKG